MNTVCDSTTFTHLNFFGQLIDKICLFHIRICCNQNLFYLNDSILLIGRCYFNILRFISLWCAATYVQLVSRYAWFVCKSKLCSIAIVVISSCIQMITSFAVLSLLEPLTLSKYIRLFIESNIRHVLQFFERQGSQSRNGTSTVCSCYFCSKSNGKTLSSYSRPLPRI